LIEGGVVGWRVLHASKEPLGMVSMSFPDVNWQQHMQFLSKLEALEFQGWAIGDVAVNVPGMYAMHCVGTTSFYLGSTILIGDVFHRNQVSRFPSSRYY
jgi:hypothetical protein